MLLSRSREYEARPTELSLLSLEERRLQANMCLMHGIGSLQHESWFERVSDSAKVTRVAADGLNVKVKNGRLELRRNFFSVRVSSLWNLIPSHTKRMMPAHLFKRAYRRHHHANETAMLVAYTRTRSRRDSCAITHYVCA